MSDWAFSIPYQHRDEPLSATAGFARHASADDDRETTEVTRQIVIAAMMRGVRTAGELLDELAGHEPAERRAMLDEARVECGLATTAEVDAQRRAANPLAIPPAPMEATTELIQHEDGSWSERPLRPLRLVLTPTGYVDLDDADLVRQEAIEASDRSQRQSRGDDATDDAEEMRRLEAERRAQLRRELPDHLKETAA